MVLLIKGVREGLDLNIAQPYLSLDAIIPGLVAHNHLAHGLGDGIQTDDVENS